MGQDMAQISTTNQMVREFERVLAPLPSEEERQSAYDAELIRRFNAGEHLTATDKREARRLIARAAA